MSCHPAPGHAIVMTVILVIIRKRSWNWGLNQHSVGNRTKLKNSKQGRRLMWTMGSPESGQQTVKERTVGESQSQQLVLTVFNRVHAWGVRPLFYQAQSINSVRWSELTYDSSNLILIFTQNKPYYVFLTSVVPLLHLFKTGIMPNFRALSYIVLLTCILFK